MPRVALARSPPCSRSKRGAGLSIEAGARVRAFQPGGASDVAARLVAPKLAEALGQPFIVENRVASGGIVGTGAAREIARRTATRSWMTFDTFASNPHLYKELPYDVVKDFAPVMLLARYPQILVVHPSLK